MSQDTKAEAVGAEAVEAEAITLREATKTLIKLRHVEEALYMEQAAVFAAVRDRELYQQEDLTWSQYCNDIVKYNYTTVIRRLRVYDNEYTRQACAVIGFTRALAVANMARDLRSDDIASPYMTVEAIDAATESAIDRAKTMTASDLRQYTQQIVKNAQSEPTAVTPAATGPTLGDLMDQQKQLQERVRQLTIELADAKGKLNTVNQKISNATAERGPDMDMSAMDISAIDATAAAA
jgi:hypothetical protein